MARSVWSASDAAAGGMTLSNGGLTAAKTVDASYQTIRGSISKSSGKLYVEFLVVADPSGHLDGMRLVLARLA